MIGGNFCAYPSGKWMFPASPYVVHHLVCIPVCGHIVVIKICNKSLFPFARKRKETLIGQIWWIPQVSIYSSLSRLLDSILVSGSSHVPMSSLMDTSATKVDVSAPGLVSLIWNSKGSQYAFDICLKWYESYPEKTYFVVE